MRIVAVTVGTSLLRNVGGEGREVSRPELVQFLRSSDLKRACAETNTLERILEGGERLYFLHSDTREGELCAGALCDFYSERGHEASLRRIPGLRYDEAEFKESGLRALVHELASIASEAREEGAELSIVATGGFKAEAAYANLVGLLFGAPVYYIHERFGDVVELPPLPVAWDYAAVEPFLGDIEAIVGRPTSDPEAAERVSRLPEALRNILTEEGGRFALTAAGEAIVERARARKREVERLHVEYPPKEAKVIPSGGHRSLWGHVSEIPDIPDPEARKLLQRVAAFSVVRAIVLGRFRKGRGRETRLRIAQIVGNDRLRGHIDCREGRQELEVVVEPGYARVLRDLLGEESVP